MKKKDKSLEVETLNSLRQYKLTIRLLRFLEIIYHTILPVLFTYELLRTRNLFFFIPILLILFIRLKVK